MTEAGERCEKPEARVIASGADWSISLVDCRAGPETPRFEERHSRYSIAAVADGFFQYRTDQGRALLHPGAVMLGNAGACFECGHDHATGDRCLAIHFAPPLFEEIAASRAGAASFRFRVAALPPLKALAPALARLSALGARKDAPGAGEAAIGVAARVIALAAGATPTDQRVSARDEKRIARVLRRIEAAPSDAHDLDALACVAAMSKYHFLRTFRKVVGVTPHQHILALRLKRAATDLKLTAAPIATIALDAGFSDLSTFNNLFRRVFGQTPGSFRKS